MLCIQANWDDYGIDWGGPVSLDGEDTVTVEELTEMLNETQKVELREQLDGLDANSFSQIDMLRQYTVARSYVYDNCNSS